MLVNVRVIVERMDVAGRRHEELFSVPADLLIRNAGNREMGTIAQQLLQAFVDGYTEICNEAVGPAQSGGGYQDGSGDRASGGTLRNRLVHEEVEGGEV